MLSKMANHAQKLQMKSAELNVEKRRAEALLCQMMPREVAEQLKMNREVKAGLRSRSRTVTEGRNARYQIKSEADLAEPRQNRTLELRGQGREF